jgi:Uma2 family endonuclease
MSLEDYFALPEGTRAEWVDGEVIVSPPPHLRHQAAGSRLLAVLASALPGLAVLYEPGVRIGADKYRIPDLAVLRSVEDAVFAEQTPVLVVEILSASSRGEDTLRKSAEYAAAGVGQYWIVDRDHYSLTVLGNNGAGWDLLLELGEGEPTGSVAVGDDGTVELDLAELLGAPAG